MAVDLDTHDKTWILHLDGFLAILRLQNRTHNYFTILKQALRITDGGEDTLASEEGVHSINRILLHLEVTKLRLRQLVAEHDRMAQSKTVMRNIDLEKVRLGLKVVYKDALLLTSTTVLEAASVSIADQNACRAVVVIAASHLISIGTPLETKQLFQTTLACSKLQKTTHEAIDAIYTSTKCLFPDVANVAEVRSSTPQLPSTTVSAIFAIWPLYAASIGCGVGSDRLGHIRDLLWRIGGLTRIPKAMSLVSQYSLCVWLLSGLIR
jgi:hypothetical protein